MQDSFKKFIYHKNFGVDIDKRGPNPIGWELVEIVGKRESLILRVSGYQYPILIRKKKEFMRNNFGFYDGVQHKLIIKPIF